jgi:hypothetical protein
MTYDPFKRTTPEPKPREEIFVWAFVKDGRPFTGSPRATDDERWEAVYFIDGALYKTQVFASRVLAEHDNANPGRIGSYGMAPLRAG